MSDQFVISATFTADPLEEVLRFWLLYLKVPAHVQLAPYNQVFQQLLDASSLLAQNQNGLNIILLRFEDWSQTSDPQQISRTTQDFIAALKGASKQSSTPYLVCICPASPDCLAQAGLSVLFGDMERLLRAELKPVKGVQLITPTEIKATYPLESYYDPLSDKLGHIPFTPPFFAALGSKIARQIYARQSLPHKVIVLDCDQTLWQGVCGEDGPMGIKIDGPYYNLQEFMVAQYEAGMLLCLSSKNSEDDVLAVFKQHPEMPLKLEQLVSWRINWQAKSENIKSLAHELQLGLDSFIFVDDNPLECAEVQANCPQVLSLQLPSDPAEIPEFLKHVWAFDHLNVTEEDKKRSQFYQQNMQREQFRSQNSSLEDFLAGLDLKIKLSTAQPEQLARLAQLSQRTNQFNATTIRRSEAELLMLCQADKVECLAVEVSDRFGAYGLVGFVIFEIGTDSLRVDTFLLSCRVLGRGVEQRMLAELGIRAVNHNLNRVDVPYLLTKKNEPVLNFLNNSGQQFKETVERGWLFKFPVAHLTTLKPNEALKVTTSKLTSTKTAAPDTDLNAFHKSVLLSEIALELRQAEQILNRIKAQKRPRPVLQQPYMMPQTQLERTIAQVWQDVLGIEQVGLDDPLADLGGESLHVVQIQAKLQAVLGQNLDTIKLFEYPTVDSMAQYLSQTKNEALELQKIFQRGKRQRVALSQPRGDGADGPSGIAIIGMAARFPGANTIAEFWQNLKNGVESIVPLQDDELDLPGTEGTSFKNDPNYVQVAAMLQDADLFAAQFFGIYPKEAQLMDPQQRVFLESSWQALEDSGYSPETFEGSIGVYAGCYMNTYLLSTLYTNPAFFTGLGNSFHLAPLQTEIGNDKDYLTTRVSFKLNLRGPSFTVQTACSTSLVAVAQACQSLMYHECDLALAGGVSIRFPQKKGYIYQEGSIVSPDGHCRAFDAKSQGTVFGNGVGVVILKRLNEALADGDDIYAVIKGWAVNNDGATKVSYPAPSVEGQVEVIAMAQALAGVKADSISYVETHGTGTPLGDPIEIAALSRVFRAASQAKQFCAIGSLKTNIGHLDIASGVAGLTKTALALKNKVIPASLHFEEPNPKIDFANSPFYVNSKLAKWEAGPSPRRAGISSFGVGGTNVHLVLEEAPPLKTSAASRPYQLIPLSAKTASALDTASANLGAYFQENPDLNLANAAYTLQVGRQAFNHRRVLIATDPADAAQALEDLNSKRVFSHKQSRRNPPLVFMFPGQGSQHANMGLELYQTEPVFKAQIDRCADLLQAQLGLDLREVLYPKTVRPEEQQVINQTVMAQPAIFVMEYALAKLWMSWGVHPQAMIGHSIGEFVAACLANVFSLEDALSLMVKRAKLMQDQPGGSMLAVRLSEDDVKPFLGHGVSLAASNGPLLCVVSGPNEAVEDLAKQLDLQGISARMLHTSHAFHSSMMDPVVKPFAEAITQITLNPPQIPILSTVSQAWLTAAEVTDPYYWANHLRQTVRFAEGIGELVKMPEWILLEVGPGQTLSTLARQNPARSADQLVLSSSPHIQQKISDAEFMLTTLGRLWLAGVQLDWSAFYAPEPRQRLHLPPYPFERKRYWIDLPKPEPQPLTPTKKQPQQATTPSPQPEAGISPELPLTYSEAIDQPATHTLVSHVDPPAPATDDMVEQIVQQQLHIMAQQLELWRDRGENL